MKEKIKRICPICGKVHTYSCKDNYCEKHYCQLLRYGKILDTNQRSIYDKNEYRIENNVVYISVYDKHGNKLPQEVLIDTKYLYLVLKYKIYIRFSKKGNLYYAYCNVGRNNKLRLHTIICESNYTVDHINGNTLDNRECNLRPANMTIQNLNKLSTKGIQKQIYTYNNKNIIKGYAATMCFKGKRYISKYYKTEEEAMYFRYLLLQLLPFETNYNLDFINKLSKEQKDSINKDFLNRFKNQVL